MSRLLNAPAEIILPILLGTSTEDRRSFSLASKECQSIVHNTPELRYSHVVANETTVFQLLAEIQRHRAWNWVQSLDISYICSTKSSHGISHFDTIHPDILGRWSTLQDAVSPRRSILGLSILLLMATSVSSLTFFRRHSRCTSCCYNIFKDNDIWANAMRTTVFTTILSIEVDLPSLCFVPSRSSITFLRNMPNVERAKIHHSFIEEWVRFEANTVYKLRDLSFVGRGTYVATRVLSNLLSRCPKLENFAYHANPALPSSHLERLVECLVQLRVDLKLPDLRQITLRVTGKIECTVFCKIRALKRQGVQVILST